VLEIDLAVALGAVALMLAGALGFRSYRRSKRPEIRGAENARDEEAMHSRRCHFCKKATDPAVDLFIQPFWYHRGCNRNEGVKS
jgi:hypothetical protein